MAEMQQQQQQQQQQAAWAAAAAAAAAASGGMGGMQVRLGCGAGKQHPCCPFCFGSLALAAFEAAMLLDFEWNAMVQLESRGMVCRTAAFTSLDMQERAGRVHTGAAIITGCMSVSAFMYVLLGWCSRVLRVHLLLSRCAAIAGVDAG
jgi:hypothetical protein